ncbi:MBL fold metallo-hydrolase [Aneurinibacillus sp. Ricciae_BoGa-3]|uniref:MBL fold metallo-hydrolase n=1 Tax=Aneurinibacillus sp. Ricciae_BoGa-3 TaxID=3022697 RepID=UPI002341433F|nr:MBL fold metallo-hydrolase [Aneurinibacillus sp. Ricciae_BoGa-3]WCK52753.1 MBL fold metallo-hydrolase [Aneurinibacillus sp. Ricciae_BoGa-3]
MEQKIKPLGHDIYQVELVSAVSADRSTGYIIDADTKVIIETGASRSVSRILSALNKLGIACHEITYVIVTHIHLDHSGGAGYLLEKLPNAKIIVHPNGARHLIDPSTLISSARQVYGEAFETLFAPVTPIPENRVIIGYDGMELSIGEDRILTFYNSPGHAYHHFAVHDAQSNGIFTGDACGITFPLIEEQLGVTYSVPTSSPTQFDPQAMSDTLALFASLHPEQLYVTHYGQHPNAMGIIEANQQLVDEYCRLAEQAYRKNPTWEHLTEKLGLSRAA